MIENYPEDARGALRRRRTTPRTPTPAPARCPFSRELWIERDDFREEAPRKFHRLSPGREVRLRAAYLVTCTEVIKDADGNVVEVRCTHDPDSRGGDAPDGRKVKGTLHWVSARHALDAEVRLYGPLFRDPVPEIGDDGDWMDGLDPASLEVRPGCKLEPSLAGARPGDRFQFERVGYFCADRGGEAGAPVFNRTATLRDTWKKLEARGGG